MDKENIGKLIRARRKEKGLSQKQLAESIQVSLTTVSKWETGVNLPDILNLDRIAKELNIPLADLLDSGTSAIDEKSTPDSGESCNETETPMSPPVPAVSDVPHSQLESLPGEASPRPKVGWLKWYAFVLSFLFIAIIIIGYLVLEKKEDVFSVEICDEYQGEYEGQDAYYIIVECNKKPTVEELIDYGEDIRKQYEKQFFSSDLIIVIYVKDYAHYKKNGLDKNDDYISILDSD